VGASRAFYLEMVYVDSWAMNFMGAGISHHKIRPGVPARISETASQPQHRSTMGALDVEGRKNGGRTPKGYPNNMWGWVKTLVPSEPQNSW